MFEHTIETRGSLFLRSLGAEYLIRPLGLQLLIIQLGIGGFALTSLGTSKATKSPKLGGMEVDDEPNPATNVASDTVGDEAEGFASTIRVGASVDMVGVGAIKSMALDVAMVVEEEAKAKTRNKKKRRGARCRAIDKDNKNYNTIEN
uniref:Uncharacterized protein n=1 Tax=Cucumis melo TaxID=3656 RepID=A0A9I9D3D0_CUCME